VLIIARLWPQVSPSRRCLCQAAHLFFFSTSLSCTHACMQQGPRLNGQFPALERGREGFQGMLDPWRHFFVHEQKMAPSMLARTDTSNSAGSLALAAVGPRGPEIDHDCPILYPATHPAGRSSPCSTAGVCRALRFHLSLILAWYSLEDGLDGRGSLFFFLFFFFGDQIRPGSWETLSPFTVCAPEPLPLVCGCSDFSESTILLRSTHTGF
jgi:hypothetical protein